MSVKIMTAIFESETLGPTERLIMLALADHADDEGRCYPSIPRLCQRTGLGERAVQMNIRRLVAQGYVRIESGGGRGHSNLYFVSANPAYGAPITPGNPAPNAPIRPKNPAPETPFLTTNPASRALNPASRALNPARDAPEPSGTIIEPVTERTDGRGREATTTPGANAVGDPAAGLIPRILHALGFETGAVIPKYWMAADAAVIVSRWQIDLGLTEAEIIQVARANAIAHGAPAGGPRVLTRHMQDFAAASRAPPLQPTPQPDPATSPQTRGTHGKPTERQARGAALRIVAADLSAGRIDLGAAKRDPFAGR